jgi:hypothetical protein
MWLKNMRCVELFTQQNLCLTVCVFDYTENIKSNRFLYCRDGEDLTDLKSKGLVKALGKAGAEDAEGLAREILQQRDAVEGPEPEYVGCVLASEQSLIYWGTGCVIYCCNNGFPGNDHLTATGERR